MIKIRKGSDRGQADYGWLQAKYSFSFSDYYDAEYLGFRSLVVMNEDRIAPGKGFGRHGHKDMEIITYVLEGSLAHQDSLGSSSVLNHGRVQRMSAGTGIQHSEFNHSKDHELHLYQIWILPEKNGIKAGYEEKNFDLHNNKNTLRLIASRNGDDGSLVIHQDIKLYAAILQKEHQMSVPLKSTFHYWLQLVRGQIKINDKTFEMGDGIAISNEQNIDITTVEDSEILFFELK